MNSYLTMAPASAESEARLRLPACPQGLAPSAEPTVARPAQPIRKRITWPMAGPMSVMTAEAASQHQDGPFAGVGGWHVTDTDFSTRLGPPSCSPPV